jgi:two-component system response regulator WspF
VVGEAATGQQAVDRAAVLQPDIVLMDLEMPELDGVEATRRIMDESPCAILIVTGRPQDSVNQVFRALGAGALDVTATPMLMPGHDEGAAALLAKLRTMEKLIRHSGGTAALQPRPGPSDDEAATQGVRTLVGIGASTGGPVAVARILAGWRAPADCTIVVVQHIDENFADHFAKWLADQLAMPVRPIEHGDPLMGGTVMIAKSNDHLVLDEKHHLGYDAVPKDYAYRPSVDVFFRCVAQHWPGDAVGILLTGMGRDGAEGLLAMRRAGKTTVAQDQASSAVYGMPRAAAELDAAQLVLPLEKIGPFLRSSTGGRL